MSGEHGRPNDAVRQQVQAGRDAYAAGHDVTIYQSPQTSAAAPWHPDDLAWVAAIHATASDDSPLGGGIVLDDRRILTCAHVLDEVPGPWVAFPHAEAPDGAGEAGATASDAAPPRRKVHRVIHPDTRAPVKDLAILVLAEPIPSAVIPAPLRCPRPPDLAGKRWWAFGFPSDDELGLGSSAEGTVNSVLLHGWIRLEKTSSSPVERGFSGGGLWSPDYQAVVAIVAQADGSGNARAITLRQADQWFKGQNLRLLAERSRATDAGPLALAAWGWSLSGDSEGIRHWRPRARGVSIDSERGYRFRGRTAALRTVGEWLDREVPDRHVLVVTGAPGAGKSAVLGRIVTTADPEAVRQLPASDTAVRATPGSVACAVHAKGKTALEVATEIAKAVSAALPLRVEDFAPAVRDALTERGGRRCNMIIDALDEAVSPAQARAIIAKVIAPLAETCSDVGAQVILGSRRRDDDGDLLALFGGAATVVDLDDARYFTEADLAAYALASLQLAGDERSASPYADEAMAGPVAARIAELSAGNFLIAGLIGRTHGLYDEAAVDPATLRFTATVDAAMREYLRRVPPVGGVPADEVLTALAFAEAPGMPVDLWRTALRALGRDDVPTTELTRFARSSAANFLVEGSLESSRPATFRLFHQALNDALLTARGLTAARADDERSLTEAFMAVGRTAGWPNAPAYLLRSLPAHAARGGLMDGVLGDEGFLLHADLDQLLPLVDHVESAAGQQRAQLLWLTPRASEADPAARAAMFSVSEALNDHGRTFSDAAIDMPYRPAWAAVTRSTERSVLEGHGRRISSLAAFTLGGRALLASGSGDTTARIWDLATGAGLWVLSGHAEAIFAVCAFTADDRLLLATGSFDKTVRLWNPATGVPHSVLGGFPAGVTAVCAFPLHGRTQLAICDAEGGLRVIDPILQKERLARQAHTGWINAVCAVTVSGQTLLATGGDDQTIRLWHPATGNEALVLEGHGGKVTSLCPFRLDDRELLAAGDNAGTVRVWDPATGAEVTEMRAYPDGVVGVYSVCAFTMEGRVLLATGHSDWMIRIWDPATESKLSILEGDGIWVGALCPFTLDDETLLAAGDDEGTVRIWNPASGRDGLASLGSNVLTDALCVVAVQDQAVVVAATLDGTVQAREAITGEQRFSVETSCGGAGTEAAFCSVPVECIPQIAIGGTTPGLPSAGRVVLVDLVTGRHRMVLDNGEHPVTGLCSVGFGNYPVLAIASREEAVRLWDPVTGQSRPTGIIPPTRIQVMSTATVRGRTLLVTGHTDSKIRVWDPVTETLSTTLAGHTGYIASLCPLPLSDAPGSALGDKALLASSSSSSDVRVWDLDTGQQTAHLLGHTDSVHAVCAIATVNGSVLLASGGADRTVRFWDPVTGSSLLTVPVHHPVHALAWGSGRLFAGLSVGLLAIQVNPDALA